MFDWRKTLLAGVAALSFSGAQAAYILDTGPGASGSTSQSLNNLGVSYQHLGVTFHVGQASSIDSVEGWIGASQLGSVAFELHQGSTLYGAALFSSIVSIGDTADGWRGATGLDWDVAAGDYTLAVIAQSGFGGWMATSPASPAGTEWTKQPFSDWAETTFNMGWRIGATEATVPEPGSLALVALGLAVVGAGAARRRAS